MPSLEFEARNAGHVSAKFRLASNMCAPRAILVTRHYGMLMRQRVIARAPRKTGAYINTITYRMRTSGGTSYAVVSSTHPASRRLENGFIGADVTGRVYHDPPRPHWGPAAAELFPLYTGAMSREANMIAKVATS